VVGSINVKILVSGVFIYLSDHLLFFDDFLFQWV